MLLGRPPLLLGGAEADPAGAGDESGVALVQMLLDELQRARGELAGARRGAF